MASSCMRRSCLWPSSWAMPSAAPHRQLPLRRTQPRRAEQPLLQEPSPHRRHRRRYDRPLHAGHPLCSPHLCGYDAELLALTSHAFRVYALNFFLMGFNVYGSSFFTALGDGVTSALISFLRTLLFQLLASSSCPSCWASRRLAGRHGSRGRCALRHGADVPPERQSFPLSQSILLKRKAVGISRRPFCCYSNRYSTNSQFLMPAAEYSSLVMSWK